MKICFFDSGVGGLTILNSVRKELPQYDYLYYGDTYNVPYSDKTEDEIYILTRSAVIASFERGALLTIIACNTASAETLKKLQDTILVGHIVITGFLGSWYLLLKKLLPPKRNKYSS